MSGRFVGAKIPGLSDDNSGAIRYAMDTISQGDGKRMTIAQSKLSAAVKAVRLRYAIPFVVLLVAVYLTGLHPWMMNWGSTPAEQQMPLPGDDLIPKDSGKTTLAITINAPSDVVWKWLVQVGQDRAGFYTYTWLENLTGADIHNANEIHPEWQHLNVGDSWRTVSADWLGGLGKDAVSPVLLSEPGHALVLVMFGAYVINPIDAHTSRLLVRGESGPANPATTIVLDPLVFTMARGMLIGLKARAEGVPDAPMELLFVAQVGWVAAGITVAGLFLSGPRARYWLVIPVLAALPALLMAHDIQAGLAAFNAVGITLLGFVFYGRDWWGSILVVGSMVMLALLILPDAYLAIGFAFALLLLAALAATLAERWDTLRGAAHRSAQSAR